MRCRRKVKGENKIEVEIKVEGEIEN